MDIGNKVLFILDDRATAEEIRRTYLSFCEAIKDNYPIGTLFVPSNLRALEKITDWQQMVAFRTEDTPSPDLRAQLYQVAVVEASQGENVYMMVQTKDGWGYRESNRFTDFCLLNDGRFDPRPKELALIE